jgi:hypothetical protein
MGCWTQIDFSKERSWPRMFAATSLLFLLVLTQASCGTSSSVQFKGDRLSPNNGTGTPTQSMAATSGGVAFATTAGGYNTSSSFGSQTNQVHGQTAGGYSVQLNVQGQMAP